MTFIIPPRNKIALELLREAVCKYYDLTINQFESKVRSRDRVIARQMFCYIAKEREFGSLKDIGSYIGGRDHTTVIHARQTIADLSRFHKEIREQLNTLSRITAGISAYVAPVPLPDSLERYLQQINEMRG